MDLEIPLPPVAQQQKTTDQLNEDASIIRTIKEYVTKNQFIIQNLRLAILQEAVSGRLVPQAPNDEPTSELMKKLTLHKQKLFKEKYAKRDEKIVLQDEAQLHSELPQNWLVARMCEISDVVRGGSPRPAGSKEFYDGSIPFLKVADLTADKKMYLREYSSTIKPAGLRKTRFVKANTLMLTNSGATLGVPKICTFDTAFNDGIAAFLNVPDFIDLRYLYLFLKSRTKWFLESASRGQGQPNLNTNLIGNTLLPIPPPNEQKCIIEKVDQLTELCDKLDEKIKEDHQNSELLMEAVLKEAFAT